MKRTSRGFKIYSQFKDTYGSEVRVQESSSAMKKCCWVFTQSHLGEMSDPHLTRAMAKRLAKSLMKFAEDSK